MNLNTHTNRLETHFYNIIFLIFNFSYIERTEERGFLLNEFPN